REAAHEVAAPGRPLEGLGQALRLDHEAAARLALGDREAHLPSAPDALGPVPAELAQRADAAHVAGPPRADPLAQPSRLRRDLAVELVRGLLLGVEDLLLPGLERPEAALGLADRAAVEPQRAPGERGEEGAVVADQQQPA